MNFECSKKYFNTLTEEDRELLFLFMRAIDVEIERDLAMHRRISPDNERVSVGAAHFDPFLRSAVKQEYLGVLRLGKTPDEAEKSAIEYGRICVKKHNEKRPLDIAWKRWKDSGRGVVEELRRGTPMPNIPEEN